jgi:hypothetical protein
MATTNHDVPSRDAYIAARVLVARVEAAWDWDEAARKQSANRGTSLPAAATVGDERLTEKEAAKYLAVSPQTVARWRKKGVTRGGEVMKLPSRMAGGRPRYSKKQLDRWIAGLNRDNIE